MAELVAVKNTKLDTTVVVPASTAAMLRKHGGWKDAPKSEQPTDTTQGS